MHVALSWRLVSRASSDVARSSGRAGTALLDRRHPHRRWLLRATTARAADGEPFLAAAVSRFLRDSPSRGHYALRAPVTRSRGARGRRRVPVRGLAGSLAARYRMRTVRVVVAPSCEALAPGV